MPDEPLIFVEVALIRGMAESIAPLLDSPPVSPINADTAVFYSINNCQPGLSGVSFGNLLIKQVVSVLQTEHPKLKQFVTLSPIPGLRRWLETDGSEYLGDFESETDTAFLKPIVAQYLTAGEGAKLKDPVARFHLGNGATLERINANADLSARGQKQSFGFMVNYLYELDDIVSNHEQLMETGHIATSKDVQQLLKNRKKSGLKELPHVS
jgi:malonyl-CoA decarboxylase